VLRIWDLWLTDHLRLYAIKFFVVFTYIIVFWFNKFFVVRNPSYLQKRTKMCLPRKNMKLAEDYKIINNDQIYKYSNDWYKKVKFGQMLVIKFWKNLPGCRTFVNWIEGLMITNFTVVLEGERFKLGAVHKRCPQLGGEEEWLFSADILQTRRNSSAADVRTFWSKKQRIFRNLWCVRTNKGRLSQCEHFADRR